MGFFKELEYAVWSASNISDSTMEIFLFVSFFLQYTEPIRLLPLTIFSFSINSSSTTIFQRTVLSSIDDV